MGSGYGSFHGSPCMSPTGMEQQQNQGTMMTMPGSPGQVQLVQAAPGAQMPSLPPWPFTGTVPGQMGACNMATMPQGTTPAMDAPATQYFIVPTTQPPTGTLPEMAPAMGNVNMNGMNMNGGGTPHPDSMNGMMQVPMPNGVGFASGGASPSWQGQPADTQQSPFPMPLSPPHDLAQSCTPSQQQQAYFQVMPDNGQGGTGNQNPFCL